MTRSVISWDSCILIDAIQRTATRWPSIAPMLNLTKKGELKIVLSTLCVAEAYFLRESSDLGVPQAAQNELIERWLEHSFLIKRAADFGTCKIAAELCRHTQGKLKPPDAIIVATALRHNASALITFDDKAGESLLKQDQQFDLPGNRKLRICTPGTWARENASELFAE